MTANSNQEKRKKERRDTTYFSENISLKRMVPSYWVLGHNLQRRILIQASWELKSLWKIKDLIKTLDPLWLLWCSDPAVLPRMQLHIYLLTQSDQTHVKAVLHSLHLFCIYTQLKSLSLCLLAVWGYGPVSSRTNVAGQWLRRAGCTLPDPSPGLWHSLDPSISWLNHPKGFWFFLNCWT